MKFTMKPDNEPLEKGDSGLKYVKIIMFIFHINKLKLPTMFSVVFFQASRPLCVFLSEDRK